MINPFEIGDTKTYQKTVQADETAQFESGEVHPFYGTFALGRDAEWACRLFVLEMKEEGEEGIGTYLDVKHLAPARVGQMVEFESRLDKVDGRRIHCSFIAMVGSRKIAVGKTRQMILSSDKLEQLYQENE